MTRAAYYPKADRTTQNFGSKFRGSPIHPNVVTLHTTEGMGWDNYEGGATAPNLTGMPFIKKRNLEWRQHFSLAVSSRSLVNLAGGVETNTLNVVQIELVGTCDPQHRETWGKKKAGVDYIYWPDAPEWALRDLADFLAWMHTEWALNLKAPAKWPAYPTSYANGGKQRMTNRQWQNFYGVCGHMHVPENVHGDPGNIDIKKVLDLAKGNVTPKKPGKTPRADQVHSLATEALGTKQTKKRLEDWKTIQETAARLSTRY